MLQPLLKPKAKIQPANCIVLKRAIFSHWGDVFNPKAKVEDAAVMLSTINKNPKLAAMFSKMCEVRLRPEKLNVWY